MALIDHTSQIAVPSTVTHLRRGDGKHGIPISGPPWIAMFVKQRIGYLKNRLEGAEAYRNEGNLAVYESQARELYGYLREAWERAVEEILLNRVVLRFERGVQTNRLKPLVDILESDIHIIDQAMGKCSTYLRGHDQAPEINETVPDPLEIKEDIKQLEDWVRDMRKRDRS